MKVLFLAVVLVTLSYARSSPVGSCPDPDPKERTEHLPDSKDCTKFWRCDHATPKQESCPSGLHFNPKLQVCDWPNRAGCKAGESGEPGDGSGGNSGDGNGDDSSSESKERPPRPPPTTTTKKPTTTTKRPTTTTKKPAPPKPPKECESASSSSESGDCGDSGDSSGDKEFSSTTKPRPPPPPSTTTTKKPTTTTKRPTTTTKKPAPPKPPKECESSSSSSESGDCGDSEDSSGESGEGDICKGATAHRWHLPHPSDKTKFYKCDLNTKKATLFQCPDKLEFNPSIQVCDWPSK
ncbi:DNA topoisomerase 1-like [Anabrus simplex]|uniref:DNA topoisomerase 1-like n=1 Tax=Anabrus simplex TaxID=316456 RepID=UPI0035A3CE01